MPFRHLESPAEQCGIARASSSLVSALSLFSRVSTEEASSGTEAEEDPLRTPTITLTLITTEKHRCYYLLVEMDNDDSEQVRTLSLFDSSTLPLFAEALDLPQCAF